LMAAAVAGIADFHRVFLVVPFGLLSLYNKRK
jgi:hypothetical protein